jgi:hypothetical protein
MKFKLLRNCSEFLRFPSVIFFEVTLSKGYNAKLFCTPECADTIVAAITSDDTLKCAPWEKIHDLCK